MTQMNSNHLLQLIHTGFRVSLGATTSLVETLADPQTRSESLSQLRLELTQRVTEWEEKGLITEQEARSFIEALLRQQSSPGSSPATGTADTVTKPPSPVASPTVQLEIEELTAQLAAIRAELEKLRNPGANS